jgi:hypothetical protein
MLLLGMRTIGPIRQDNHMNMNRLIDPVRPQHAIGSGGAASRPKPERIGWRRLFDFPSAMIEDL